MSVAVAASAVPASFRVAPEPVIPLSVEQYHEMIRTGILESEAPIEFLEGWLVNKMVKNPQHSAATARAKRLLAARIPDGWSVDSQPITTADSEPEPDVAVIRGLRENYVSRHPISEEIALVVEIADSSLERDRNWKKRIHATAGIKVYWIVNLIDRQVEVYSEPANQGEDADYLSCRTLNVGDDVAVVIDGHQCGQITVAELLA